MRSILLTTWIITFCGFACAVPTQATDCNGNGVDDLLDLQPTLGFGAGVSYVTTFLPRNLAIGDVTGDGYPDVVTSSTDPVLGVLRSGGDGTFPLLLEFTIGDSATGVSLGDLDGDTDLDIIAASKDSNAVYLLRNIVNGIFQWYATINIVTPTDVRLVETPDLDGDQVADLVLMYADRIIVQLNDGTGNSFSTADTELLGSDSTWLAVADVDNANGPDLIVTDATGNVVRVLLGAGGGAFGSATSYATGGLRAQGLSVADFTGDGFADIAVANRDSDDMSLLTNDGDGTFTFATTLPAGDRPFGVAASDFDGVNGVDLAVANYTDENALVYLNNGSGAFTLDSTQYAGPFGRVILPADPDQDGDDDLMVLSLNTSVVVLENDGNGEFPPTPDRTPVGNGLYSITAADFDNDLDEDLAVIRNSTDAVYILQNDAGALVVGAPIAVGDGPFDIVTGYFNADTYVDIAVTNSSAGSVSVLLNNATGDATFAAAVDYPINDAVLGIATADVDNDTDLDLLVTYPGADDPNSDGYLTGEVTLLTNNGGGVFTNAGSFASGEGCAGITAADFNADTLPDVAVANLTSGDVAVHLNLGGGAFSGPTRYAAGTGLWDVQADDLNGDFRADLVAMRLDLSDVISDGVWMLPGLGDGTFLPPASLQHTGGLHITTADLDQDGDPEIIAPDFGLYTVSTFPGLGDLTFDNPVSWLAQDAPAAAAVFDLDGDGKRELAVCTLNDGNVIVLHNQFAPPFSEDVNGNDVPDECEVVGDVDLDGDVDLADLAGLLAAYGACVGDPGYNPAADIDNSGCVGLSDLAALLANYGFGT